MQTGPYGTDTTYTRVMGGMTMHWEAKTPRLLPEDFQMRTRFGRAYDRPLTDQGLEPNVTLTLAALCFKTAQAVIKQLRNRTC